MGMLRGEMQDTGSWIVGAKIGPDHTHSSPRRPMTGPNQITPFFQKNRVGPGKIAPPAIFSPILVRIYDWTSPLIIGGPCIFLFARWRHRAR